MLLSYSLAGCRKVLSSKAAKKAAQGIQAVTWGFDGGLGGTVSGLAARVTCGFEGGLGGTVNGLAARVTWGFEGGRGGTVSGLAARVT
jgi:hypothetical protein